MKLAVVRVRGRRNLQPKIKKTLELLNLHRTNHCVVVEDSPQNKGMIHTVKDYVAFGPIGEDALARMLYRKGRKGSKRLSELSKKEDMAGIAKKILGGAKVRDFADPVFQLRPPSRGYKDIKRPYPEGDLGARPDMSGLVKRMV